MVKYRKETLNSMKYKNVYQFDGYVYSSCRSERIKVMFIRMRDEKKIKRLEERALRQ